MSGKLTSAQAPPRSAAPVRGEIYAHVFENAATGLARDLFWNLFVELRSEDEDPSSLAVDWLTWPVRRWRDVDGVTLGQVKRPDLVEASFYHGGEHHPAELTGLALRARQGASFELAVTAAAHVDTDGARRTIPISFACRLLFTGVFVVADNLAPKPRSSAMAAAAVSEFIALDDLQDPRPEGWRYVLEPVDCAGGPSREATATT